MVVLLSPNVCVSQYVRFVDEREAVSSAADSATAGRGELVPLPFNTPLKRLASKEMGRFEREYTW